MTVEYSLQSRSEALALRTALANRTFSVKSSEGGNSQVADVIRRIDYEAARFSRLLGTLPPSVDATGLGMPEADLLLFAFEEFARPCSIVRFASCIGRVLHGLSSCCSQL